MTAFFSREDIPEGGAYPDAWIWRGKVVSPTVTGHVLAVRIPILAVLKPDWRTGELKHHYARIISVHWTSNTVALGQDPPPFVAWTPCKDIL